MFRKRLISLLLIIPFLINGSTIAQGQDSGQETIIEKKIVDNRALMLQSYLAKYNSPMQYQAHAFVEAADKYNLDWKFVAAIAGTESTFGKFVPGGSGTPTSSYNAWGWGVYGTQAIYFKSWEEGINAVSEGLRKNYLNKGLNDPYAINKIYAASPTWGSHVSYFLQDMEKFQKEYEQNQANSVNLALNYKTAGNSGSLSD